MRLTLCVSFELRVLTSLTFFKSICSIESSLRFHVCGRKQLSQYMATSVGLFPVLVAAVHRAKRRELVQASPDVHDKPLLIQATTMWFAQRDMCSPGHLVVSQNNLHRVLYSMHSRYFASCAVCRVVPFLMAGFEALQKVKPFGVPLIKRLTMWTVRAFIHMVAPRAVYASVAPFDFSNELTGEQFARVRMALALLPASRR